VTGRRKPELNTRSVTAAAVAAYLREHPTFLVEHPEILLDLVVHEPTGPVAQVITTVEARYEEETDFEYETVTILPDGVSVPVRDVHRLNGEFALAAPRFGPYNHYAGIHGLPLPIYFKQGDLLFLP
jgi:hypothetical protein